MENQSQNTSVPVSGSRGNTANVPAAAFDVSASAPITPVGNQVSTPLASLGSSQPSSPTTSSPQPRPPRGRRSKLLYSGIALIVLAAVGAGIIIWRNSQQNSSVNSATTVDAADRFSPLNIPLDELAKASALMIDASKTLSINGQLKVNNGFVIAPTKQPTAAVAGQLYYDQDTNALNYYNGSQFVSVANQTAVNSIAGASGNLTLGGGLSQTGNQISNSGVLTVQGQAGNVSFTAGPGLAINGTTLSSTGVLSFGGQTGAITVGNGLGLTGNQLKNTGVVSVSSASSSLTITNDGNGNITLTNTSGAGTVQSPGGTTGRIAKFTGAQTIADSLLSDNGTVITVNGNLTVTGTTTLSSPLSVGSGGVGVGTLAANGVLVGNGTSPISSVATGTAGLCLISTAGAPSWQACPLSTVTLQAAYDNSPGGVTPEIKLSTSKGSVDIQDADTSIATNLFNVRSSNAGGFGQILFGVGNTGAIIAQNGVNSASAFVVENAAGAAQLTVDTTNSKVIIGTLQTNTITPSAALTIGATGQSFALQGNASSTITSTSGANTTSLVFQTPTASVTYRFLTTAAGTYDICTSTGNCAGAGSGVTTPGGTAGTIAKFTAGQTIGNSIITDNGTTVTIGGGLAVNTITPSAALTVGATSQNLTLQGATVSLTSTNLGITNSLSFATPASSNKTITIPNITGTICLDSGNCLGGGGGGANTALSNLTGVAINASLVPGSAGTIDLGSTTNPFRELYLAGTSGTPGTNNFKFTGASTSGTRVITLPDATGTVCLQSSANCGFIQNTTTLQTGANVAIQSVADTSISMRIRQRATQSAETFRIEDSNGALIFDVDGFGGLHATQSMTIDKNLGVGMASSSGEQLRVATASASTIGFSIYGSSGQTANLLQVIGAGSATPVFSVNGSNQTSIQNIANSTAELAVNNAAGNNLLRVDSTNSALILGNLTTTVGAGVAGLLKLADGTNDNFAASLQLSGTLTGNVNFQLPVGYTGNQAVCISGGNCNYAPSTGGTGYIQNGTSIQTANFAIQSATAASTTALVRGATGQTATILDVQDSLANSLLNITTSAINTTVPLRVKAGTDSTTAFNVKSSLDNNAFTVDTVNNRVGIGLGGANTPTLNSGGLEIKGAIRLSGSPSDVDKFITPLGASLDTKINIPLYDVANFSQLFALGLTSTSSSSARGIMVADARAVAHQPSIAVLSPNEGSIFGLSWDGGNGVGLLKSTTDSIAIQGTTAGTGLNIATFKNFGASDGRLGVNNGSPAYTLDVAGDINTSTQYRIGGVVICTSSGCTPASGSGNYIRNQVTVQAANMFIQGSVTTSPVAAFEQAASGTADVLDVLKNDGVTKYLSVSSAGNLAVANGASYSLDSTTSGSLTSNGSITITAGGGSTWSTSSGNLTLQAGGASAITVQTAGAGTVNLGNQNSTTINIGAGSNIVRTFHIGDGGTSQAQTITLGSTGGASATTIQGGTGNINLTTGGATSSIIAKDGTDNTAAFQVQNSASASLLTVDTANSNIALLGNNSSALSTWNTTTAMSVGANTARVRGGAIAANGYLYHLGGVDGTGTTIATTQYAKLNADGTVGTWAATTSLPGARRQFAPVVANGYIYVIGGRDNANATQSTSYYAKLNPDGTIGTWNTTTALASARFAHGSFAYNGYMYVLGGFDSSVTTQATSYYARINPDGTLGSWATTTALPATTATISGSTAVANGYIYVEGGWTGAATTDSVLYAKLNTDGTVGTWTTQAAALTGGADEDFQAFVANGYLYAVGGDNGARVLSLQLNSNGSLGTATTLTAFPVNPMGEAYGATANGYFYLLGGSSAADGGGTVRNTVYYASTSRVKVGGGLDLVNYSGRNLAEGGTGGQLTAGNTVIVGTLQVQDASTFARGVTIGDSLTVAGPTMISPATNTTTAFQVQAQNSNSVLRVDTVNERVAIGVISDPINAKLNIATGTTVSLRAYQGSTFDVFQLANATGDVLNVTNTGNTTVKPTTNSTTAFLVQNATGTATFTVDTTNQVVKVASTLDTITNTGLTIGNANATGVTIGNSGLNNLTTIYGSGLVKSAAGLNSATAFQVQNATGVGQLTVDTANARVYVGPTAGDTTGSILVLGNKTNWTASQTSDPTGVAGAMYYNSGLGQFRCYEVDHWRDCTQSGRTGYHHTFELGAQGSNSDDYTAYQLNSGGFSQPAGITGHPGITQFNTLSSATAWIYAGSQPDNMILLGNNDYWRYETDIRLPSTFSALSNSTDRYNIRSGFLEQVSNGDPVDGCFFKYSDNVNTGKWQGTCISNNTASTCDTTVTVAMDTWYRMTVVVNAAGTSADFRINGVSKCTVTTNIPTGAGRVTGFGNSLQKVLGTADRDLDNDYIEIEGQFGTPR